MNFLPCTSTCEAGTVQLLPLESLRLQLFPMDCQSTPVEKTDPHRGEFGCYLVQAINLVAECADYDPVGLLLYLPQEKRYATWDSSHCVISVFAASVDWTTIQADPAAYINAQWEDSVATECLVPWPTHPYSAEQIYDPTSA